jgi:hypothetical protein
MTRQPAAIDYLLELVATGSATQSGAAAKAIEPLKGLPGVTKRLQSALKR